MTRKLLTALLALAVLISAVPCTALAEGSLGAYSWTGEWETNWGDMILTQTGAKVSGTYTHDDGKIEGTVSGSTLTGTWSEAPSYAPPGDAEEVEFVMSPDGKSFTGKWRYGSEGAWGNWEGGTRNAAVLQEAPKDYANASSWATAGLDKASGLGLIPDILKGADLTRPITRKEFAAVSVKLYEKLSGKTAMPAAVNPFKDTNDPEVLKAYHVDITSGIAADKFGPDVVLNREQAAAMLTRVFKKVFVPGWTLKNDGKFAFDYAMPPRFADDAKISDWAKPSVYFMVSHGIISGMGNNTFGPRNITTAEQAAGYANATREQALNISLGVLEKLGDGSAASQIVPADAPPAQTETDGGSTVTPPDAASTSVSPEWLAGFWGYSTSNGSVNVEIMYEFKADGTFYKVVSSMWKGGRTATDFKGKYQVSGDKLILSDQLKGTGPASCRFDKIWYLTMDSYDSQDIPAEDAEYVISRTSDDMLIINDTQYTRGH
ncbi:MAG: S-layer homology domain-containing protein [Firmicutes bacterium]|nr:S-layer homology domain-containing protein [Bacillota bacterium]